MMNMKPDEIDNIFNYGRVIFNTVENMYGSAKQGIDNFKQLRNNPCCASYNPYVVMNPNMMQPQNYQLSPEFYSNYPSYVNMNPYQMNMFPNRPMYPSFYGTPPNDPLNGIRYPSSWGVGGMY